MGRRSSAVGWLIRSGTQGCNPFDYYGDSSFYGTAVLQKWGTCDGWAKVTANRKPVEMIDAEIFSEKFDRVFPLTETIKVNSVIALS